MVDLGLWITAGVILLGLLAAAFTSFSEKEFRAGSIFGMLAIGVPGILVAIQFLPYPVLRTVALFSPWFLLLLLMFPLRRYGSFQNPVPTGRVDERDIMFSRRLLKDGTERYKAYYERFPDRKQGDDAFRNKPGLLSPHSNLYHELSYTAAEVSFDVIKTISRDIDGEIWKEGSSLDPERLTVFLRNWARKMGALDLGITELRDYHLYSYRGRDYNYGEKVENRHRYALAFTVEMDKEMMDSAPKGPTLMESAHKYLDAAIISVVIARFIRRLGYPARAHLDGDYELICPLVARDAGLGDIGRMGLLMTPKLGPRVRIGVVTTDMGLIPDALRHDPAMLSFCESCKKCAEVCPSQAIPFGLRNEVPGMNRWKIDQEACYDLWCSLGTDCGRCMAVCPYSHPDNWLHSFVRFGIRNSLIFRNLALHMDHLFYGRKPRSRNIPDWMRVK